MKINVVIPTKDRYHLLINSINSLLKYNDEFIQSIYVVDNGSKDDTHKISRLSNKINLMNLKENIGIDGALELGMRAAIKSNADAILLTDDDSIFLPNTIKEMVELMLKFDNKAVVNALPILDNSGKLISPQKISKTQLVHYKKDLLNLLGNFKTTNKVHFNGCLISKEIITKIGFPNKVFFSGEETEYGQRIINAGFNIYIGINCNIMHPEISIKYIKFPFIGYFGVWRLPPWKAYYYTRNALLKRGSDHNIIRFLLLDIPLVGLVYFIRFLWEENKITKMAMYYKGFCKGVVQGIKKESKLL